MKRKKNRLRRIFFEIKKGIKRLYWSSFHLLRNYKLKNKKFNKKIFKIGIILPTKERSVKFSRMLDSFLKNTLNPHRIYFLILFDENEKEKEDYYKIIENGKFEKFNFSIFEKDFETNSKRINYLVENCNCEILLSFNDDAIIDSRNWDDIIDKEFSKIEYDSPYCIWPECGQKYPYLHTDFPIVNYVWVNKLGYLAKDIFLHWWVDTWICELCFVYKKFHLVKEIKIKQFSAHSISDEVDKTHLKNMDNNRPQKDYETWCNSIDIIKKDAKKLFKF